MQLLEIARVVEKSVSTFQKVPLGLNTAVNVIIYSLFPYHYVTLNYVAELLCPCIPSVTVSVFPCLEVLLFCYVLTLTFFDTSIPKQLMYT